MRRIVVGVVGILGILVVAAAILITSNLDSAIKLVVEAVGSKATGTAVTLQSVNVSLRNGRIRIGGLVIANPSGYKTPNALELGDVDVTLDLRSLLSDPVHIHEIVIDNFRTMYEVSPPHGSNIGVIQANVSGFATSVTKAVHANQKSSDRRFIVDDLYIRGGHVAVSASLLGGHGAGRAIPDIHLHDVGKEEGGITSAEISAQIASAMTTSVLKSLADMGIDALHDGLEAIKDAGASVISKAKGLFHRD